MKDLHLKYHCETGVSHDRELYISHITSTKSARNFMIEPDGVKTLIVPTEDYLEWLEDLAEKYLKQQKINTDANKAMAKFEGIKLCFESLKSNINAIDSNNVEAYEIIQIADDCDDLESEIYD